MIKFQEQHQPCLAHVSINHLFQLGESAWRLGHFRECDQIQPPNASFQRAYDGLEWPGRCHAESLDLELSYRHFISPLDTHSFRIGLAYTCAKPPSTNNSAPVI